MGRSSSGSGSRGSSGGGGGGRSGGHRVSNSSRSSRSSSGSSHSSGSSFGGGFRPRRNIHNSFRPPYNGDFGYGRNMYGNVGRGMNPNYGSFARGRNIVSAVIAVFVIMFMIISIIIGIMGRGVSGGVTKSTIQREALSKSGVDKTAWYMDDLNYIGNKSKLENGMKKFYDKTGVQPYLYITDNINGDKDPTDTEIDTYLQKYYEDTFTDGQHFILMYLDQMNGNYITRYYCGPQAKTLMDEEASEILLDYIDRYATSDMDDETFFSTCFSKAADRIMNVTTNKFDVIKVGIILVIAICVVGGLFVILKKKKEILQAQRELAETPIGADPLIDKYESDTKE